MSPKRLAPLVVVAVGIAAGVWTLSWQPRPRPAASPAPLVLIRYAR